MGSRGTPVAWAVGGLGLRIEPCRIAPKTIQIGRLARDDQFQCVAFGACRRSTRFLGCIPPCLVL